MRIAGVVCVLFATAAASIPAQAQEWYTGSQENREAQ